MVACRLTAASVAALALAACAAEERVEKAESPAVPRQEPEQDHYGDYMEHYLPEGDMGYADKFVGRNADYNKYMKQAGGSDDYTKYLQRYGGGMADYEKYVKMYSAMAGQNPTSADAGKDGDQQLTAWSKAMNSTYKTFIPGSFEHFASASTGAREGKDGDFQSYMNAYAQGGAGGDYHKYMDYEKYMKGQGADYQKYMDSYKQYMDYQKYMQGQGGDYSQYMQGAQGAVSMSATGEKADAAESQAGDKKDATGYKQYMDYQKYMQGQGGDYKQYMDYQKYMNGQGGDYKKYMDYQKYMNGQDQGGDYSKYMDYQKYMNGQGQGGDYKQYMDKYAADYSMYAQSGKGGDYKQYMNYQKYMGSQGGDYKQYMDYQKYMGGQGGDYKQYMDKYAGDYSKYTQSGNGGDHSKYMDYQKYMNGGSDADYTKYFSQYAAGGEGVQLFAQTRSADDANTTEELKEWRAGQKAQIDQYVPMAYQHFAEAPMEAEYRKNLARITGEPQEEEPVVLYSAAECNTTEELKEWRNSSEAQIKEYTPKEYQKYALSPIQKEYERNLARLENRTYEPDVVAYLSADQCNTTKQLKAWREEREEQAKMYVPKAYQKYAMQPIEDDYAKNLARLEGKAPEGPVPYNAADCKTEAQLKAWYKKQQEQLSYIPKPWRKMPKDHMEEEYKKNLARIRGEEKKEAEEEKEEKEEKKGEGKTSDDTKGDDKKDADDKKDDKKDDSADGSKDGSKDTPKSDPKAPADAAVSLAAARSARSFRAPVLALAALGAALPAFLALAALRRRTAAEEEEARLDTPFLRLDAVA